MDWLKLKALGVLAWVKQTCAWGWNYTVDPPPRHLKFYFWLVLAMSVGGYLFWAPVVNGMKWFFHPVYEAVTVLGPVKVNRPHTPLPLVSPYDVVTTVPPSASPKDLAPLELVKAEDAPAKRKTRHKRAKAAKVTSARDDLSLGR